MASLYAKNGAQPFSSGKHAVAHGLMDIGSRLAGVAPAPDRLTAVLAPGSVRACPVSIARGECGDLQHGFEERWDRDSKKQKLSVVSAQWSVAEH